MDILPTAITDFNRTQRDLQKFWLFSMFVAGKNSDFASAKVSALMNQMPQECEPIDHLRNCDVEAMLRKVKVGQYTRLTKAIIGSMSVDLNTATLDQLMAIHGVGAKTSRFFLVHSRINCRHAVLDVHLLKFLRDNGHPLAPKQTPSGKAYLHWEKVFLNICDLNYLGESIASIDLRLWMEISGRAA